MLDLCKTLSDMGPKKVVITSVASDLGTTKIVSYDTTTASFDEYPVRRLPFSTCERATSLPVFLPAPCSKTMLHAAIKQAADFLSYAIEYTYKSGSDPREGVQVEPCLGKLLKNEL